MNQPAMFSIIVPVFNAEAYIEQCIQSVMSQSYQDVELIIVNDGSTDGSLQKCLAWKDDARIKIISTENCGVSHARNLGLQIASGKWVMFLDSDDYLMENSLENLMALTAPDVQEIVASYTSGEPKEGMHLYQSVSAASLYKMSLDSVNNKLLPEFYEVKSMSFAACWAKLYLNRVIQENGIRFHEGLCLSEDSLFNLDYLACIENAVVSNLPVLFYRENSASVTKVFSAKHIANRFRFFDILKERYDQDAAVTVLSLLFYEICKIEKSTKGHERKRLEEEIIGYLSKNMDILHSAGKRSLSKGKWQRHVYRAAAICFGCKAYRAGLTLLRVYAAHE